MESVREVLERRYISRTMSARFGRARWRAARERGDEQLAREQWLWREQCVSACAEIHKIARDLGLAFDTEALRRRAIEEEAEIERTLQRFEARRQAYDPAEG